MARVVSPELRLARFHNDDAVNATMQMSLLMLGQATITPDKLKALSLAMQKRLSEGPPELRQAYMRLILDLVTIDHHDALKSHPSA
jgi:hypothetical protein